MNRGPLASADDKDSLTARIAAALRPEFDQAVIVAPVGHPVLGLPPCRVSGCAGGAITRAGLCKGHHTRWHRADRPDVGPWVDTDQPPLQPQRILAPCVVEGCRRGQCAATLCSGHYQIWKRSNRPELGQWITGQQPLSAFPRSVCAIGDCTLDAETKKRPLCRNHDHRWRTNGMPPIEQFVTDCDVRGADTFDLRGLPDRLVREIQYGLQCRVDESRLKTQPRRLMPMIRCLRQIGAHSLRENTIEEWDAVLSTAASLGRTNSVIAFVRDTLASLDRFEGLVGWDTEYPRDIWKLTNLGFPATRLAVLRFDRIHPQWMRNLAKRWCRWRLSTGSSAGVVASNLYALTRFCRFLEETGRGVPTPAALDRPIIEEYLAWVAVRCPDPNTRRKDLGGLASFLRTLQQHRWAPNLSPEAILFKEDYPPMPAPKARALSEFVASQLELESNLSRFEEPRFRVLTEILQRTGLRVGDARRLTIDCIDRDQHGAAYLRYHNHKMRRDARTPIDDALADAITAQQQRVREQFPTGPILFPMIVANLDGTRPIDRAAYAQNLDAWVSACEIRTEAGDNVHVRPHQFRHTYATRLINSGVPQHVVKKLLDHDSDTMTAHYARLSMETVREEWCRATKVDIHGHEIREGDGELAEAVWLKNSLSRAKMALPNGYCTLPLQQTCEYANACLTCPMFLTTPEFLPQHRTQLIETRVLIESARARGQQRVQQMNETVEKNLLNIIGTLQTAPGTCTDVQRGRDHKDNDAR